jgi:hypothetical protein
MFEVEREGRIKSPSMLAIDALLAARSAPTRRAIDYYRSRTVS